MHICSLRSTWPIVLKLRRLCQTNVSNLEKINLIKVRSLLFSTYFKMLTSAFLSLNALMI